MQLQNYYYWFKNAIPSHVCDDIVRYAKSLQDQMAVTGGFNKKKLNKKEEQDLKKKRDSDIIWLDETETIPSEADAMAERQRLIELDKEA